MTSDLVIPLSAVVILLGFAVSWGYNNNRVGNIETRMNDFKSDSDRITRLEGQVSQVVMTLNEVRNDVKQLVRRP